MHSTTAGQSSADFLPRAHTDNGWNGKSLDHGDDPCRSSPPTAELPRYSLGYLEHRGRMYALEDLMDPAYRASSDAPFVREFDVDNFWAGSGSRVSPDAHSAEPLQDDPR
jgi:hypothetical protein